MASVASLLAAVACFAGTHGSTQLVTVQAPPHATSGSLSLWTRQGRCWRRVAGPWTARLGRSGIATHKREGDGATPAGTYRLGGTVYGIAPDPGLHVRYHRLACGDWWDEDPGSATYNSFRHVRCGAAPPFGGGSEALWRISPQYRYFAVIDYNAGPAVPAWARRSSCTSPSARPPAASASRRPACCAFSAGSALRSIPGSA